MAAIASLPDVTDEEAAALSDLGLHTTDDLLRTDRVRLVARLPSLTVDRVLGWQAVAELSLLEGLTLADAVALHDAGADGIEEAAGWPIARWQHALPDLELVPLVDAIKDAVLLDATGVVNGTVSLRDGTPVEGADVRAAGVAATTDAMGRFRVTRLPLGATAIVEVHHPELGYRLVKRAPVLSRRALQGLAITLGGKRRRPPVLSQRLGHVLPPLGGAPVTTRVVTVVPPDDEVLRILEMGPTSTRVASAFLEFTDGRFVRTLYRMPDAQMPADAARGLHLVRRGDAWVAVRATSGDLRRLARTRRAIVRLGPPPADPVGASAYLVALLEAGNGRSR